MKEFNKLDLFGKTLYIYVWKTICEERVYRCQVVNSDLVSKTLTIILIDYGRTMIVPCQSVREVTMDTLDPQLSNTLFQRATIQTFLLSTFISKRKSVKELNDILSDKYYKFRKDFEVGGVTFVSIYDIDKKLVDSGLADTIDVANMSSIANSMSSTILSNNKNDLLNSYAITCKELTLSSNLRHLKLDYVTLTDVAVTRVSIQNNLILLTIRILVSIIDSIFFIFKFCSLSVLNVFIKDPDTRVLRSMLDSIDRQNLKLVPVLDVHTSCLIIFCNELVRAIILEVKIERLYIDLVDYGIKTTVPRTAVFEIPSKYVLMLMLIIYYIINNRRFTNFS